MAATYTIEEQIVSQFARTFEPEDDFAVLATTASGIMAQAVAKELYAPRLSLMNHSDGKYVLVRNLRFPFMPGSLHPKCVETYLTSEDIFSLVTRGKYQIIMQPLQIDKHGYMNISLLGDKFRPTKCFVGSRNVPSNTVNQPRTLYFVPNHSSRIFVEAVDFKSGVGYGEERKNGTAKWGAPIILVSNLCVMDFEEETGRMRVKSVHTGVTIDQVVENTGFDLVIPENVAETPAPSEEELRLLREVIDPLGVRRLDLARGEDHKRILGEIMGAGKK